MDKKEEVKGGTSYVRNHVYLYNDCLDHLCKN